MYEKKNRIIQATKYYGGGGAGSGTDIAPAKPQELKPWLNAETAGLNKFGNNQPLLQKAETGALSFWDQLGSLLSPLTASYGALPGASGISSLEAAYQKNIAPTIAGGGYSPEMARQGQQVARVQGQASGTLHDNSALINEYQQSENARNAALNTALSQGSTLRGQEQQIFGGQQTAAGGIQGLQTGGLNQLLGVEGSKVGNFAQLLNPAMNAILGNLQARIAQAQISNAANMNSENQNKGLISSGIESVGSIAGAGIAASDERLKTKIRDSGLESPEGIPYKFYEFKTRPGVEFLGPMAQDVERKRPDAVITDPVSGVKMVDFWKLRVPMMQLKGA